MVKILSDNNLYTRTYVHKILYLLSHDNCFEPTVYGPYCAGVQRILQYIENNPNVIYKWYSETGPEIRRKINEVTKFIKQNDISTTELSYIAKLDYLLNTIKAESIYDVDLSALNQKSIILGWLEFCEFTNERLEELWCKLDEIREILIERT